MEEEGKMDDNNNNDNTIEEEEDEEGKVEENQIRRYDVTFTQGSMGFGVETPEGFDEGSVVTEVAPGVTIS